MSTLEEFNTVFIQFREMYEECSCLINSGIEYEITDENKVSQVQVRLNH
jgi:hypothetical protein